MISGDEIRFIIKGLKSSTVPDYRSQQSFSIHTLWKDENEEQWPTDNYYGFSAPIQQRRIDDLFLSVECDTCTGDNVRRDLGLYFKPDETADVQYTLLVQIPLETYIEAESVLVLRMPKSYENQAAQLFNVPTSETDVACTETEATDEGVPGYLRCMDYFDQEVLLESADVNSRIIDLQYVSQASDGSEVINTITATKGSLELGSIYEYDILKIWLNEELDPRTMSTETSIDKRIMLSFKLLNYKPPHS